MHSPTKIVTLKCFHHQPVKNAPAGKKYVRCPCNCLLICKSSSIRIACPRVNCKRIINLAPSPITPPSHMSPGMSRVICVHCSDAFMVISIPLCTTKDSIQFKIISLSLNKYFYKKCRLTSLWLIIKSSAYLEFGGGGN